MLTLTAASPVAFCVRDAFAPRDEFGLILDGMAMAWTVEGVVGDHFSAFYRAVLVAGTYLFSLEVTTVSPAFADGEALAALDLSPVSLPATALLLAAALGGVALLARRGAACVSKAGRRDRLSGNSCAAA